MVKDKAILAYTAGVFDADGTVAIDKRPPIGDRKSPKYTAIISIQMGEKETIYFIAKNFGFNVSYYDLKTQKRKDGFIRRPAYRIQAGANKAALFLKLILPYSLGKKNQIILCLEFCDYLSSRGRGGKRLTRLEIEKRESYYMTLRKMKILT